MTRYPKDRVAALTDGIFAVAMTLLVLDLRLPIPATDDADLWDKLRFLSLRLDDYVISFVVLCAFWLSHHRLVARIRSVDVPFLWLNCGFVLFTTFVPAVTSLVGNYPHHRVAALVYGANVSLILLFEILMWWHATRRLFDASPSAANAAWRHARRRFVAAIVATAFAIAVAMAEISAGIGVVYSSYCYLLLLLIVMFRDEAQGPPE